MTARLTPADLVPLCADADDFPRHPVTLIAMTYISLRAHHGNPFILRIGVQTIPQAITLTIFALNLHKY